MHARFPHPMFSLRTRMGTHPQIFASRKIFWPQSGFGNFDLLLLLTTATARILPITARCLWCLSVYGDKQGKAGRPGQPLQGARRGAISIKKILGENRGTCI